MGANLGLREELKLPWGKDADQVIYGEVEKKEDDEHRCPICNSRIDEFGYCGCGGKLGVS